MTEILESSGSPRFCRGLGRFVPRMMTDRGGLLLCFTVGFVVRLIPELLAFSSPIGFDTVYYALVLKNGVVWGSWTSVFTSSWLLCGFLVPAYQVTGGDPFAILKFAAPILFGLNVAGIYWFARKMLGWNGSLSLLAGGFFALQLASLRISWDLLRNTLGMGVLLFALPLIKEVDSKRGFVAFVFLSMLTVFAHEYAAVTLFVVVLGTLFLHVVRKRFEPVMKRLTAAVVPALTVFVTGIFLRLFPPLAGTALGFIDAGDCSSGSAGGVFFLVNYLQVKSAIDSYMTYGNLVFAVLVLFVVLYASYLVFVVKGFFRNSTLDLWTGLLLVGAFGCLAMPFLALEYWHRWMFMLAYPFTFYAIAGLRKSKVVVDESLAKRWRWTRNLGNRLMVLATVILATAYLVTPVLMMNFNLSVPSVTSTAAYFSTSPTVPYEDVGSLAAVFSWLDGNMGGDSCVLLQHAFLSWGRIYLDKSRVVVHFEVDAGKAEAVALENGFGKMFFIWWNVDIGWYGVSVPAGFVPVHSVGRLSVFERVG